MGLESEEVEGLGGGAGGVADPTADGTPSPPMSAEPIFGPLKKNQMFPLKQNKQTK
jgi:hypothetical protein